jgi:putative ABC transport system permease protein
MGFLFQIAWRNVWRNGRRTLITATAMGASVSICIFLSVFTNQFYSVFFDLLVTQKMGHIQIQNTEYAQTKSVHDTIKDGDALIEQLNKLEGIKGVSAKLYGNLLVSGSEDSAGAQVVGVFPEAEDSARSASDQIVEGAYLSESASKEVIVGVTLFDDLDLKLNDELFVYTQASDGSMAYDLYNLVGVYKSGATMLDRGIQLHVGDLQELLLLPTQYHEILVVDQQLEHIEHLQSDILSVLGTENPIQAKTWWETSPQTKEMMAMQDVTAIIYLSVIFFIAGFGILNTMLMAVYERTREIGVMLALGLQRTRIIQIIVIESTVLAALASVLGVLMGGSINYFFSIQGLDLSGGTGESLQMMGLNFEPTMYVEMQLGSYWIPVVGLFVIAIVSSLWPAYRASRLHPVDAIRSE